MSDVLDRSVLVPCSRCQAMATLDLVQRVSRCPQCAEQQTLDVAAVHAVLAYQQDVAGHKIEASRARWFDFAVTPLAAFADIIALGVSMTSAFWLFEQFAPGKSSPLAGLYIAIFGLSGWGVSLLLLRRWLGWSERPQAALRVTCPHCRASYIALCGAGVTCPLCRASWIVPEAAPLRVERAGVAMVLGLQLVIVAIAFAGCIAALIAAWCGVLH